MKKLLLTAIMTIICIAVFPQAPGKFNYQGILRTAEGNLMIDTDVTIVVSILQWPK